MLNSAEERACMVSVSGGGKSKLNFSSAEILHLKSSCILALEAEQ